MTAAPLPYNHPLAPQPDELDTITESGGMPPDNQRLKDAQSFHSLFSIARIADRESAYDRSNVQSMLDGDTPFNQAELDQLGQGSRTNLNWLDGKATCNKARAKYYDLTSSVEQLVWFELESDAADDSLRALYEDDLATEFTALLRGWGSFEYRMQNLQREFVTHGLGVAYHEDEWDWRFNTCGLSDFLLPRHTPASEEEVDYCFTHRRFLTTQLYRYIRDPEVAAAAGWNVEEVRKAIILATVSRKIMEWEEIERELKENDVWFGRARSKEVHVVHGWFKEFDGTYSHYINLEDGSNVDFLYKKANRFANVHQCFHIFPYELGNGNYHSIRGLGYDIFPQIQTMNQLRCGIVDATFFAASHVVQPSTAMSADDMAFQNFGPFSVVSPGLKFLDLKKPNLAGEILPVVEDLERQVHKNLGTQEDPGPNESSGERRTKFEVKSNLEQHASGLPQASMHLFYQPLERLFQETFRRLVQPGLQQNFPGGREAYDFRKRCLARGIPSEIFHRVKKVHAVKAIGLGSSAQRLIVLDEIAQMAPMLDEVGRRNAYYDRIEARVGPARAARYVPRLGTNVRPAEDEKFAQLENVALGQGFPFPIALSDNAVTHLKMHFKALAGTVDQIKQGTAPPQIGSRSLHALLDHAVGHLDQLKSDPTRIRLIKEFNVGLNTVEGFLKELDHNIEQEAEKQAREGGTIASLENAGIQGGQEPGTDTGKAPIQGSVPGPATAQGGGGQPGGQGISPLIQARIAGMMKEHEVKLSLLQAETQQKMQIQAQMANQKAALDQARFARAASSHAALDSANRLAAMETVAS